MFLQKLKLLKTMNAHVLFRVCFQKKKNKGLFEYQLKKALEIEEKKVQISLEASKNSTWASRWGWLI